MSTNKKPISPAKRYFLRILEMAEKDSQIGALMPIEELRESTYEGKKSCDRIISNYLDGYADRPAFGERAYDIVKNVASGENVRSYKPEFQMTTYQEVHDRIRSLSMAWRSHPHCQVQREEFVCIMGFASVDFAVIDMACAYARAVVVPLQSSTSGGDLQEIFSNIEPVVLGSTLEDLPLAAEHASSQKSVKCVIVFNYDAKVDRERIMIEGAQEVLKSYGTHLYTLDELITFGENSPFSYLSVVEDYDDKMAAIIHSSGSTGKPKGAVIATKAIINDWQAPPRSVARVTVLMAPLNHIMGRMNLVSALRVGGTGYFTLKPDMSTMFEDIRLARPTFLSFFPRVFELIHQHFQNEVTKRIKNDMDDRGAIESEVMAEMRSTYLGDRLLLGVVGSAPTSHKVMTFIRECFDILLVEGYGNTEAGSGGLTNNDMINREVVLDYKLKDVPELGYYSTDKPFPRGELCVKTKFGVKEYYKQPEATAGLNDADGYNLTGDIVEERAPDHIVIVDRRKDVLKLSQGEYVAVGPLGTVFEAGSAIIHQIYVYGNSIRSYLLAVVIPEMDVVKKKVKGDVTEPKLKNLIRLELQKVAAKEGLKNFEVPRDFIIEKEPFSQENGMLSSVRKRLRPAMKRKYGPGLEAMYEEHDRFQNAQLDELKDANSLLSTKEKLVKILESNLGVTDIEVEEPRTFNELGGDSLGAALFSVSIEEIFGTSIGADVLLSPQGNLDQWAAIIDADLNEENKRPSFNSIHGKGATYIDVSDLTLDRFISKDLLDNAKTIGNAAEVPNTVLLTGANGFLGHILCLKWLEELSTRGGELICLVRAEDNESARARLDAEFCGVDAIMESRYNTLAKDHLEVIAGDISKPSLGLSTSVFYRLSQNVDRICHPAALVNHRLAYQHMFGPNVLGVTELIRLGITSSKKPIDFISTVGVLSLVDKSNGNTESAPLIPKVRLTDHYAAGYAASKWAGEHLLHKAHEELGLTSNLFRCDIIMPDEEYKGQMNSADMVTRLLFSIIKTGLAPYSFYQLQSDGSKSEAHYDGAPVNILSQAIVGLAQNTDVKCATYNAQNYLTDNVSLDSFVDWIETAGYNINRITDHKEWVERMEIKLKSLPEEDRQRSIIDLMAAYNRPYPADHQMPDCSNFEALVRDVNEGKDIPHLTEGYIHKYLEDMVVLRLIDTNL